MIDQGYPSAEITDRLKCIFTVFGEPIKHLTVIGPSFLLVTDADFESAGRGFEFRTDY